MTYEQAITYLESCTSFGIKPGLTRIRALLSYLDSPEQAYKTIHVTGTNGKGSVAAFVESALFHSGIRVGKFTSPHLQRYTERLCVNEREITPDAFGKLFDRVSEAAKAIVAAGEENPTQFELLTAAAFLFFKEQEVEYAVIEVGMGGLLDSTNVITPEVAVITNVSLDHQAYCGNTVEEIAAHKAGIIKAGVPVVTAAQEPALGVIKKEAKAKKAKLAIFGKDFLIESRRTMKKMQMITLGNLQGRKDMYITSLLGIHQSVNLACAVQVLQFLKEQENRLTEETIREGIARTTWSGRFEVIDWQGRTLILDGAHNAGGAEAFAMTYKEVFGNAPKTMVMQVLQDKEIDKVLALLVSPEDYVYTVPAPTPRSTSPEALAAMMPCGAVPKESVAAGMTAALEHTKTGDIVVVCGSLYILGEVKDYLLAQAN